MGFALAGLSIGTAVGRSERPAWIRRSTRPVGARVDWRPVDRPETGLLPPALVAAVYKRGARRKLVAAIADVALHYSGNGWRLRLGHEVSHHIGGRGGGQGRNVL